MNNKLKIKISKKKGFTLLLSLLVISIILSVGFGVFDTMTKELKISGIGRESQISFYAADAGIECAYYWDIKHPDETESYFALGDDNNKVGDIKCGGENRTTDKDYYDDTETSSFSLNMGKAGDGNEKCAKVTVKKEKIGNNTKTTIESKGYNYPCNSNSSHKVERAIRVVSITEEFE